MRRRTLGREQLESRLLLAVELVADVYPGSASSEPQELTAFRDGIAFTAFEPEHGRELWLVEGERTTQIEIHTGTGGSSPEKLTPTADRLFFVADNGINGRELWVSDGTVHGTFMLKDILPNAVSANITEMVAVQESVFFLLQENDTTTLWTSDGSESGTQPVSLGENISPNLKLSRLTAATDQVFFVSDGGANGIELWRSDGTPEGTTQLTDSKSLAKFKQFVTVGDRAFFLRQEAVGTTNGTVENTIPDFIPIEQSFTVTHMVEAQGKLAFRSCNRFNWSECVWRQVDPSDLGVTVAHVASTFGVRPEGQFMLHDQSMWHFMTAVQDWDEAAGYYYVSGARIKSSGVSGVAPGRYAPGRLESPASTGVWRTDLTAGGTELVARAETAADNGEVVVAGSQVYFAWRADPGLGKELYRIEHDRASETVQFNLTEHHIRENGETVGPTIEVVRSHAIGNQSVGIQVYPATAENEGDLVAYGAAEFRYQRFTVNFADGESSRIIPVAAATNQEIDAVDERYRTFANTTDPNAIATLRNDELYESNESFHLRIWPISSSLVAGEAATTTVTIVDDDPRRLVVTATDFGTKLVVGGSVDHFDVSLNFAPDSVVVVQPSFDAQYIDVQPAQLRFAPEDWDRPQQFRVTGISGVAETQLTVRVDPTSSDQTARNVNDETMTFGVDEPIAFEQQSPGVWLADINVETRGLSPLHLAQAGDYLFFTGDDGIHGRELWRTDGTADGTILLRDIVPGQAGAFGDEVRFIGRDEWQPRSASIGEVLYFFVEGNRPALWSSTGHPSGTRLVSELPEAPGDILAIGEQLFFAVGRSIWVSDGTAQGTRPVPTGRLPGFPRELTTVGGSLFFQALQLWTTDGTEGGTLRLTSVPAEHLTAVGGTLFFAGGNWRQGDGVELWKSDGTLEGTMQVKDLAPGVGSSHPANLQNIDGTLYFSANGSVWTSDGTRRGTVMIRGANGDYFKFGDDLYFVSNSIYRADTREAITPGLVRVQNVIVTDDVFYFTAYREGGRIQEFWKSDGTVNGAIMLAAMNEDPGPIVAPGRVVPWNDRFYFAASDGAGGVELWESDGSNAGTRVVYDHQVGTESSIDQLSSIGGRLYFTANDGVTPAPQVWFADARQARLLVALPEPQKRINDPTYPGSQSLGIINFKAFDDEFVFTHAFAYLWASGNGQREYELWRSDGTGAGTRLLAPSYFSFFTEDEYNIGPTYQTVHDGKLYFETGRYDGEQVSPLPEDEFTRPSQFFAVRDQLFFSAITPDQGRELWVTTDDFRTAERLTELGEQPREDGILRPRFSPQGTEFAVFRDHLLFTAGLVLDRRFLDPTRSAQEIWISDGTGEGTRAIAKPLHGHLANFMVADDQLFFTSNDPPALWKLTDLEQPPRKVKEFVSIGKELRWVNDELVFAADAGDGMELWSSDGTPEGTQQLADIAPGAASSNPDSLAVIEDRLYFAADDGIRGREVWVSDGTAAGTELMHEIFPGAASSNPEHLVAIDHLLYLVADDGIHGRELWQLDTRGVDSVLGDANGDGLIDLADFLILAANFGQETSAGPRDGDFDGNGRVDFVDFLTLSAGFRS